MSTYENDLRLEEIGTGERSGTWGTATNTNLELIANALSYSVTGEAIANASTHTITMQDGVADEARSFYLKCTGGGQACTVTLAPNTLSKVWMIENTTSYTLTFSQGSGANVAVLAGQVKMIATDGAGSGGAVFDLMQDLAVPDLFVDDDLTLQSDAAVLGFGADKDVTLTHVADTGLLLNAAMKVQFRDAAISVSSSADATLDLAADGDINLTAGVDINIPANVGLTFGNDGEKIEGDGTDLTIAGNNINLTAVADVVIPANVGLTFGTGEKIEGDSTDLTVTSGADINLTATADVNIPSGVGLTFGDDGEKIEGDGTDLTITGNNINLTATADVVIPANVGITFGTGEKIEGDSTDLTITSGAKINLTATSDVVVPANVGITFGTGEKIEGDNTDLTITSGAKINLAATSDVHLANDIGMVFGDAGEKIEGDGTDLTINSSNDLHLTATTDINIPANVGLTFGDDGEKIEGDGTNLAINSSGDVNITATTVDLDGNLEVSGTITLGSGAVISEAELEMLDGITAGTVAASKAVVVDANKDAASFRNLTSTGAVTAGSFVIGSADINENDLEAIDGITAGTVAASKAMVVDTNKDITGGRNLTITGELDAATGDFSGNVDIDGDLLVGDDLTLDSDAAVLGFGADTDVTLTHVADTGLLLNSTMAIQFNDASQFINAPSATVLDINATDEIELNATLVDVNANLDVSGTALVTGVLTTTAATVFNGGFAAGGVGTFADGSAGAPSITNTGDTNTGIFFPAADTVGFGTGGTEAARFDSSRRLLIGSTASQENNHRLQITGGDQATSSISVSRLSADQYGAHIEYLGTRSTSVGSNTIVQDNDTLGLLIFRGDDGTDFATEAASITGEVDGTPGSNDMPGRLVFKTTADGAATGTERMRIDSSGNVGINTSSPNANHKVTISDVTGNGGGTLGLVVSSSGTSDNLGRLHFGNATDPVLAAIFGIADGANDAGALTFRTEATGAALEERMRIDSSGSLIKSGGGLIKTDGTGNLLEISGSNATNTGANIHFHGNTHASASQLHFKTGSTTMLIIGGGDIKTPTPGTSNVRLGENAGDAITANTNYNVLIGDEAGTALDGGDNNVAVGYAALYSEDGHGGNVAVGKNALYTLNAGADGFNVAVGFEAGVLLSTGTANIAIGAGALDNEQAGRQNVAIGYNALGTQREDSINRNTAVGYNAGATLSTAVQTTLLGHSAGGGATMTGDNNVALGYAAGNVLTSGSENVFVGVEAGDGVTTSASNTGIGFRSLSAAAGASNTALGIQTGLLLTGSENVLIGNVAGSAFTDADQNVAVGSGALLTDVKGDGSVAVGTSALQSQSFSSVTNTGNTALGHTAGKFLSDGQNNTFLGNKAAQGITGTRITGDNNTAVGYEAGLVLQGAATGNQLFGNFAGDLITTGTYNVCLGYDVGSSVANLTTGNKNVLIGYKTSGPTTGDNAIGIGDQVSVSSNDFSFGKASNIVTNDFDADANWSRSSDERLKKNITNQTLGLDFINDLRTVKYNWKPSNELDASDAQLAHLRRQDDDGNIINDMNTDVVMHNFIAQEVKAALDTAGVSEFAGWKEDQFGVQQVSREMFVIPLVKAVQELSTKLDAALARIATLEG